MKIFYTICFAIGILFVKNCGYVRAENFNNKNGTANVFVHVVVVNMKQVAEKSSIGKIIDQEIAKLNEEAKKRLVVLEKSVKEAESKKESKERIEELRNALYATVQAERERITNVAEKIISTFQQAILNEVKMYAQNQKVLVFDAEAVMGSPSEVKDVTQSIVDKLDNKKIEADIKQILQMSDNNG